MHEHKKPKPCKHELKFCDHCDTVYCEKCQNEWKKNQGINWRDLIEKEEHNKKQLPWKSPYQQIYMSVKESHNHA